MIATDELCKMVSLGSLYLFPIVSSWNTSKTERDGSFCCFHSDRRTLDIDDKIFNVRMRPFCRMRMHHTRARVGWATSVYRLIRMTCVHTLMHRRKLRALVYDILPSTTAVFRYAIGSRKLPANEQFFFCWCSDSRKFVTNNSDYVRRLFYNRPRSLCQLK